jgi:hypothetical protein
MTTTYAAIPLMVNGQPYVFSVNATDGTEATMVNLVSGLGIGDTFSNGGTITYAGPVTLNSSDGTGASKSILGAVLLDAQNNVVAQFNWVDPETAAPHVGYACKHTVGLNFALKILTANA